MKNPMMVFDAPGKKGVFVRYDDILAVVPIGKHWWSPEGEYEIVTREGLRIPISGPLVGLIQMFKEASTSHE